MSALGKDFLCAKVSLSHCPTSIARLLSLFVLSLAAQNARAAESTWEYTVQVSAAIQTSPPRITLSWPQDTVTVPGSYTVYRKTPDAMSWGAETILPGTNTSLVDTNVAIGSAYEYQIVKAAPGYTGYGYICAGINAPLVEDRGKVVLIVDSTYAADLSVELNRLERDLIGDGWQVLRHDVARNETPANVKALIKADYDADPANVQAVFLFGRVPVLRSGNLNVDGHQARPMPADVFYGDMDGDWPDANGDGIFDPSNLPSDVELQVGRVDFANMPGRLTWGGPPTFPGERELLRRYLDKDHGFRHGLIRAPRRALVGNRFGAHGGEAFAAGGYRNFAPLIGASDVETANVDDDAALEDRWVSMLSESSYLWAYGCGGGGYASISGLGDHAAYNDVWSTDIVAQDAKAVFTMMFGSWFGDWDSEDNVMRSMLATPTMGLTCSWSGRPHHFYHHMGLGETIGYGIRLSQNNSGLYRNQVNRQTRGVHIALMGDPTLRMHPVAPPAGLTSTKIAGGAYLAWTPSPDAVDGHHVYRAASAAGSFARLTSSMAVGAGYVDTNVTEGTYTYMVRAVKLVETPSGSYYNASQGIFLTVAVMPVMGAPVVTVAADDPETSEGGIDPAAITFTRTGSTASPLTVNYSLSGTGARLNDYRRQEGDMPESITIPAGAGIATLTIHGVDDFEVEGPETIVLTIAPDAAYSAGYPATAAVNIVDDDEPPTTNSPPTITLAASETELSEGASLPAIVTFTRTGNTDSDLSVFYRCGGSATKWNDYRRYEGDMPVSVRIPAGATSATLAIFPTDDGEAESAESFTLTISNDPAYVVGSPAGVNVTIADNDSSPLRVTSFSRAPDGGVKLTWNSEPGKIYRVLSKNSLADADWTEQSVGIMATNSSTAWSDNGSDANGRRYYRVRAE